ncbi:nucleic-acid-binding protein from transposon X-element [Trichonephila clavipes]|nr:nucleic-acid-binding protein from transposon X-element [Trichonephila clavipes]
MEAPVDDQCITMEDLGPIQPKFPDEQRCMQIKSVAKEIKIFSIRKDYVAKMLEVEESDPSNNKETKVTLETELKSLEEKIAILEEPLIRSLDRLSLRQKATQNQNQNNNSKANNKNKSKIDADFVFPTKTTKTAPAKEIEKVPTNNTFAALNTANEDDEDVSPPKYKIKPIFMRMIDSYNLILQEIHRNYPTATNTHTKGYMKIEAQSADDHRDITNYLKEKQLEHYVIEPPSTRPLKLVIKGLPETIEPEDIKNDLISKGINILKVAQLKNLLRNPLPIYMIEIARDDKVNDIYQVRSCLYMQIKLDPFRKGNRITQCYNCNFFHHASQNCSMKTRCLKCGENHRTGACQIKEKIENPLCINCNAKGHMASSTECPLFPKPRKGKGKSQVENVKRHFNNSQVIPGVSYSQALNPEKSQQMAAPGKTSSASESNDNNKNNSKNTEALNAIQNDSSEFGFLQAILEIRKKF